MSETSVSNGLPGAEIVGPGLDDLAAGCDAGPSVPEYTRGLPAAHRLYERLAEADRRTAHSRHDAIARRTASSASALEHARGR